MKKIGIISELNLKHANYGNRLQSYALNKYLNTNYDCKAESITLKGIYDVNVKTKNYYFKFVKKIKKIPSKIKCKLNKRKYSFAKRIEACNNFTKRNTILSPEPMTFEMIQNSDYDIFITGSDVVWAQVKGGVHRIRFLDFKAKKAFEKLAYAPSFGRDWIPEENVDTIKKFLSTFKALSVREKSSIKMLKNIGIENVQHVCDPTLLINREDWQKVEKAVDIKEKYIFVYLLGKNKKQRKKIEDLAKKLNLKIVSVPHANEVYDSMDEDFGDYRVDNCSPEEWIWLIHNAEYVIIDSFHGVVFATIFEKKFLVAKRYYIENINNRMIDYLDTIEESDKLLDISDLATLDNMKWNYDKINENLSKFINRSKDYLNKNIGIQ